MAQLKGPIQFIGSMGNIRVYFNKTLKRYIVSTKGGSIKELIMKSPDYARQRENMSEFKSLCVLVIAAQATDGKHRSPGNRLLFLRIHEAGQGDPEARHRA